MLWSIDNCQKGIRWPVSRDLSRAQVYNLSRWSVQLQYRFQLIAGSGPFFFQDEFTFLANAKVELLEKDIS